MNVEVITATQEHAIALVRRLPGYVREDLKRGWGVKNPKIIISRQVALCPDCRAILADGVVLALFGVEDDGNVWFLNAEGFEIISIKFIRESKKYFADMLEKHEKLWSCIQEDNHKMIRWLEWCGFEVLEPVNGYRGCVLCAS
jgi:hypothetical protein